MHVCSLSVRKRVRRGRRCQRFSAVVAENGVFLVRTHLRFVSPGTRDNGPTENPDGIAADVGAEDRLDHGRLLDVPHVDALVLRVCFKTVESREGDRERNSHLAHRPLGGYEGETSLIAVSISAHHEATCGKDEATNGLRPEHGFEISFGNYAFTRCDTLFNGRVQRQEGRL